MNIGRIVVAVDFTPGVAQRTAWVLRDLFPGAEPIFVHTVASADDATSPREAAAVETACMGATARVEELASYLGIDAPRWTIAPGEPADVIAGAVLQWGAELVAVGPHEARRWAWLTGNTVERIVQRTRRPVLVAQGWPASLPAHVVVALEHVDRVPRNVSSWMQWLYSRFHTRFRAIHGVSGAVPVSVLMGAGAPIPVASTDAQGAGESGGIADQLAACGIPREAVTVESDWGDPLTTVLDAAERDGSDLIIVGESHRARLARTLRGDVTRTLLESAGRPVLVVPVDEPPGAAPTRSPR